MGRKLFPFTVYDGFSTRTSAKGFGKADNGTEWKSTSTVNLLPYSVDSQTGLGMIEGVRSRGHTVPDVTFLNVAPKGSQGLLFAFRPTMFERYTDFGPVLLRKDANNYACLRIQAGFNTVSLWRRTPADQSIQRVFSVLENDSTSGDRSYFSYPFSRNQWYWCRFEFDKSTDQFRFRTWTDGSIEPSGWQMRWRASEYVGWTTGVPGFMSFDTTNYRTDIRSLFYYDDLTEAAYTNGPVVKFFDNYPVVDDFDRLGADGWGQVPDATLVWYGNSLDNPLYTKQARIGKFGFDTANNRCAMIDFTSAYDSNGGYWAFLGDSVAGDMETSLTFATGSNDGKALLRVGVRGQEGLHNGAATGIGYALEVRCRGDSSVLKLVKRSAFNTDVWTDVLVNNATVRKQVSLTPNVRYRARVQLNKTTAGWTLRARLWKAADPEPGAWTLTASGTGDLDVETGAPFINAALERSATVTDKHKLYFYRFAASQAVTGNNPPTDDDTKLVFRNNTDVTRTDTTATVTFRYKGDSNNNAVRKITYWPVSNPSAKVGPTVIPTDPKNLTAEIKTLTTTLTGLTPLTEYIVEASLFDGNAAGVKKQLSFITAYKGIFVQTPFVTDVTTNSFLITIPFEFEGTFDDVMSNTTCTVEVFQGSRVLDPKNHIQITKSKKDGPRHTGPQFYAEVTGLLYDVEYGWKVTLSDPDGTTDTRAAVYTAQGTVKLEGERPELYRYNELLRIAEPSPIEIEPTATSAKVTLHYRWDVLNRINFKVRYRPVGNVNNERWTEVGGRTFFQQRTRFPSEKSWSINLFGLTPGLTYQLEVTVEHPAGIKNYDESVITLEEVFLTATADGGLQARPKHYLFKVYEPSRESRGVWNFLTTWADATQPEFAYHENGGVSDMTIRLPRPVKEMYTDQFEFGNRIDCWVIDHTSNGIGRNLVLDGDISLGSWVYSNRWSIDPRGGPDESAALKVSTGLGQAAQEDYALSEYIELANSQFRDAKYEVSIGIGNLFDDFEDEIIKKQVKYSVVSSYVSNRVAQLYPTNNDSGFSKQIQRQLTRILDNPQGALRRANTSGNYSLLKGVELRATVNNYHQAREIEENGKAIGAKVLLFDKIEYDSVPYVLQFAARVVKGQVTAQIEYYNVDSPVSSINPGDVVVSEELVTTRETSWELLKMVFTPPMGTRRMRVRFTSQGETEAYIDKVVVLPQEYLLYRGTIESVRGSVEPGGEMIEVEVLGLVAKLTDFYVPFAQWVDRQPKRDQPKLIDPYMFDDEDPPALLADLSEKMVRPRETFTGERRQSAIVFPEISETHVIVRVYYDGDANHSANCKLFFTRNLNAEFPQTDQKTVTKLLRGDFVFTGRDKLKLRADHNEGGDVVKTLPLGTKLVVLDGPKAEDGWDWYKVQTTNARQNSTGWLPGELLRTSASPTSFVWQVINEERGRSHPDRNTGTLFEAYNWDWTEQRKDKDGNKQDNPNYEVAARRDKRYFEFKVTIDGLDQRRNYQFVAQFTDSDGVIDQTNIRRPDANTINTASRLLFPEMGERSPFTSLTDIRNSEERRSYEPPTDPSVMARKLIDLARLEDDYYPIYYDADSIKATGNIAQYTFRDTQLRNSMDKIRELCPPGWHWFISPEGRFHLRGPQHTMTHRMRLGEEVLRYNIERTIKNLKNIVIVRGRQDEDASEPDGQGSVSVTVRDELSISKIGGRYLYLRDSNIKDQQTASTVAYGRLEENKRVEQQGSVLVVDEKEIGAVAGSLHGYNVEAFQPGDFIIIDDAGANSDRVYWDQAIYNAAYWDAGDATYFDNLIQIKSITYRGDHVEISLSQRPPSAIGDFAKLVRWQQMQENTGKD